MTWGELGEMETTLIKNYLRDARGGDVTAAKTVLQMFPDSSIDHPARVRILDTICVENYIRHARGGNVASARMLLHLFCAQSFDGGTVHPLIMEYVATAFGEILTGKKSEKALQLRKNEWRPNKNLLRDIRIAVKVRKRMERGEKLYSAALTVGEEYGLHESRIQDIYRERKQDAIAAINAGIVVDESAQREYDDKLEERTAKAEKTR